MGLLKNFLRAFLLVCTLSIPAAAGIIHGGGDRSMSPPPRLTSDTAIQSLNVEQNTDTSGGESTDLVELIVEAGSTILRITFNLF